MASGLSLSLSDFQIFVFPCWIRIVAERKIVRIGFTRCAFTAECESFFGVFEKPCSACDFCNFFCATSAVLHREETKARARIILSTGAECHRTCDETQNQQTDTPRYVHPFGVPFRPEEFNSETSRLRRRFLFKKPPGKIVFISQKIESEVTD